jgi:preprotein translocase, SecE subunit, bacterial
MADEKKVIETKAEKPAKENKPKFNERFQKFLRDYKSEFKKIVWPTWDFTLKQTGMVIVSIVLISASIFLIDTVFSKLLQLVVSVL